MEFRIAVTDAEYDALCVACDDPREWVSNAVKERARQAAAEAVRSDPSLLFEAGTSDPVIALSGAVRSQRVLTARARTKAEEEAARAAREEERAGAEAKRAADEKAQAEAERDRIEEAVAAALAKQQKA